MSERIRAKPDTPERYLWRKPGARHLSFRFAVPVRYRGIDDRKIIQCCLGTSDRRQASLKAAQLRCELHEEWTGRIAAAPTAVAQVPTDEQLAAGAAEVGFVQWIPMFDHIAEGNPNKPDEVFQSLLGNMRAVWRRFYRTRTRRPVALIG